VPIVEVECCCGNEFYSMPYLRFRCPIYKTIEKMLGRPYIETGFGNLYGSPSHDSIMEAVKASVQVKSDTGTIEGGKA